MAEDGRSTAAQQALLAADGAGESSPPAAADNSGERGVVPMEMASQGQQFEALLRKNALLKRRQWGAASCCAWCPLAAFCELVLPIAVLLLLWWARSECVSGSTQCTIQVLAGWGGDMPLEHPTTECKEGLPLDPVPGSPGGIGVSTCTAWTEVYGRPRPFHEVLAYMYWSEKRLALAVERPADRPKVERLRDFISEHWHPAMNLSNIPCVDLEKPLVDFNQVRKGGQHPHLPCEGGMLPSHHAGVLPDFKNFTLNHIFTAEELEDHLTSPAYGLAPRSRLYGAIVFSAVGGDGSLGADGKWSYSIRLNATARASPWTEGAPVRPLELGLKMAEADTYLNNGFTSIQLLLNRYIIGERGSNTSTDALLKINDVKVSPLESPVTREQLAEPLRYVPQALETVPFPVSGTLIDGFFQIAANAFPIVFMVAFMYTHKSIIAELIVEKETKVRESLRMLGVSSAGIIGSWYTTYGVFFAVMLFIFALVAHLSLFLASDITLLFLFFWLWNMALVAFAWLIHTFFNKARVGGIVGVVLIFAQWIVYESLNRSDRPASPGTLILLMVMPNGAFCLGLSMISKFEAANMGVTWSNLFLPVDNSNFAVVLLMLLLDTFLWTIVGWYLDRVWPKEFGVRLPPHFLCMPSYWRSDSGLVHEPWTSGADDTTVSNNEDSQTMEAVPAAVRASSEASGCFVRLHALRRVFSTPGGTKVAVADLNLSMYSGQILALLGHNGAGKTTTINMLTGMMAPTSGDANIAGFSIWTGMASIRRIIGVCPQHDVLWQDLTVGEHLRIYCLLRGVHRNDVPGRMQQMMEEVGLTEKINTRASSLSGGQRRKLSLCLAIIGQPRVCFLDEPTSGMDPFSRRSTWNMIRNIREGRVTVLTTHFMDEADILGDRIAIMAEGRLQCCGSAFFLKHRFGAGYRLVCARIVGALTNAASGAAQPAAVADQGADTGSATIELIRKHVREAEVITDVSAELSMRLPMTATASFPGLFAELDAKKQELQINSYGLSMVTLEEVFLRIANGWLETDGQDATAAIEAAELDSDSSDRNRELTGSAVASGADGSEMTTMSSAELPEVKAQSARSPRIMAAEVAEPVGPAPREQGEVKVACQHLVALYRKRYQYGRRDAKSILCTVLLPVVWLAFGLWLLQRVGNRQLPEVDLAAVAQYGPGHRLAYNATAGLWPWSDSGKVRSIVQGMEPFAEALDLQAGGDGMAFGRNYSEGLPVINACEEHPSMLSKCWRDHNLCPMVLPQVQALAAVGMDFGCSTDRDTCSSTISKACSHGAQQCTDLCLKRGQGVAKSVCKKQCDDLCKQATKYSWLCDLLWNPLTNTSLTVAWACPVDCASAHNNQTCAPGTKCRSSESSGISDAAGILAFERQLYRDGQGTKNDDVAYGAVKAYKPMSENAAGDNIESFTVFFNTSARHAVPSLINLLSSSLKKAGQASGVIEATNHPLPLTSGSDLGRTVSAVVNLFSTFVVIQAFSFIPAAIVAYIVREREADHNSKHQQLISGVGLTAYWSANFLWDVTVYFLPLGLSLLFIWAYNVKAFVQGGALLATFVTMLGYGLAIAPFSYLLSFLFSKHTTAQVICLVANFVTGLLLVQVSQILSVIDSTKDVNASLMWIFRLFPGFGLGHGLLQICVNSVLIDLVGGDGDVNLFDWDVAGKDILYLYVSAPCFFVLTIVIDYIAHSPLAAVWRFADPVVTGTEPDDMDEDVKAEADRVATGRADNDVVRLASLRKVYRTPEGAPKAAVKGLSFGLPLGECFGFLGINGAGKTSTLNMLTGAVLPSGGNAYLGGFDVVRQQWLVRRLIGFCPQHDALLDRLTVREHLRLFGSVKGIPRAELEAYCEKMMRDLSLQSHVDKLSMTLSGGNKRKLSLAISMMGCPALIFLDEPSTGVDPAARRLMWNVISGASTERQTSTVVLTTHNMEEAEALCSRIGIMVGGRLRCIGSNQHLKMRFGTGYQIEARLRCPSAEESQAASREWKLPERMQYVDVVEMCNRLGNPDRAALVRPDCEEGRCIYEALERLGYLEGSQFAEWWSIEEIAKTLLESLQKNLPGLRVLERHGRTLRLHLPSLSLPLAVVFRHLESCRTEAQLLEAYGLSQTSLEQIFNNFAARQEEETGPVRGVYGTS